MGWPYLAGVGQVGLGAPEREGGQEHDGNEGRAGKGSAPRKRGGGLRRQHGSVADVKQRGLGFSGCADRVGALAVVSGLLLGTHKDEPDLPGQRNK